MRRFEAREVDGLNRGKRLAAGFVLVSVAGATLVGCNRAPSGSETRVQCRGGAAPLELQLERALPVEGVEGLEPSGLFMDGDALTMVSDKHDRAIYALSLGTTRARARALVAVPALAHGPLDFEGLPRDADGPWLLASEAQFRVLKVTADGNASWATPSLRGIGEASGLFQTSGAGLEGIARVGSDLLLAAEREPRGLLESNAARDQWQAFVLRDSTCPAPLSRPNDFADVTVDGGRVFALVRNSHLVVELHERAGVWEEGRAWSYARTENDARFAYTDRKFGLGEGLALDARHVYVVLDNNGTARAPERSDHRPLLFVFRRPTD